MTTSGLLISGMCLAAAIAEAQQGNHMWALYNAAMSWIVYRIAVRQGA